MLLLKWSYYSNISCIYNGNLLDEQVEKVGVGEIHISNFFKLKLKLHQVGKDEKDQPQLCTYVHLLADMRCWSKKVVDKIGEFIIGWHDWLEQNKVANKIGEFIIGWHERLEQNKVVEEDLALTQNYNDRVLKVGQILETLPLMNCPN